MSDLTFSAAPSNKLGFWFAVFGIMLSVMTAAHTGDPEHSQTEQHIHWILPSAVLETGYGYSPSVGAAIAVRETKALVEKAFVQIEPVSLLPLPPLDQKLHDKRASPKSSAAVRGKQAEHLFRPIIMRVAHRHQVDPAMVKAIIMAESSFNPKAISRRGAAGLMQLMPNTAKSLGVIDVFDPENNINAGVLYFKRLLKEFRGDVKLALAAYNAGSRKVKEYQGIPPFKTTRIYIKKVFEYYRHYKNEALHPADRA